MQHDRVTSEQINITLEKSKSKELVVEMEVALVEEIALVDVIGRRDGAWSTAHCEFPVSETIVSSKVKSAYGPMWPTRPELIPVSVA